MMAWDPTVLRKYNTTGHFRLLNQVRSELKGNPLVRPKDGERVADVNRSRALVRALEGRGGSGGGRSRRSGQRETTSETAPPLQQPLEGPSDDEGAGSASFRERLSAIDWR